MKVTSRKMQLPLLLCFLLWTRVSQSLDLVNVASDLFSNSLSRFNDLIDYSLSDSKSSNLKTSDPDVGRTTPEIIVSRKFQVQTHSVITKDGYYIGVHRIVNYKYFPQKLIRPVILHHGLLGSSIDFVINSPGGFIDEVPTSNYLGNNLGFELAKRGFDVWMPNSRGNIYSSNHTAYDSKKDPEYWDFSLDEHIAYDLPAVINYVKSRSNTSTVAYIGHSQGTAIMFGLLSSQPHYSNYIKPFIALAPVTTVAHISTPVQIVAHQKWLEDILSMKSGPFLPDTLMRWLAKRICTKFTNLLCADLAFFIAGGWDSPQLNYTRVGVYTTSEAYGTSIKNMLHWAQLVRSGRFAAFDYGPEENKLRYGSVVSPSYSIEKINSPNIAIFSGLNDGLSTQLDIDGLRKKLRVRLLDDYVVPYKLWSHLDFIWGMDAGKYVNTRVLRLLNLYT